MRIRRLTVLTVAVVGGLSVLGFQSVDRGLRADAGVREETPPIVTIPATDFRFVDVPISVPADWTATRAVVDSQYSHNMGLVHLNGGRTLELLVRHTVEHRGGRSTPLLLHNGRIFTADSDRPWAEAILIDGRHIKAVGDDASVRARAGEETTRIDLGGHLVIPGLNDAHVHEGASPPSEQIGVADGEGVAADPSWEAVRAAVTEVASRIPEGTWIRGTIGPSILEDSRATRFALDSLTDRHPVMLVAASGHGTLVNTTALERLNLSTEPDSLLGGWYHRLEGSQATTGVLREAAEVVARRRLSSIQGEAANAETYRRAARDYVGWGVTSAQQLAANLSIEEALGALEKADIPVRWALYRWPTPKSEIEEAWPAAIPSADDIPGVAIRGVKWMLDGTPLERGTVLREPYADRPGWHGRLNYSPAQIRSILDQALQHDEQLALHVTGDSTLTLVLRTMDEMADAEVWREQRVRIEHGDGLTSDLLPLAAELGVVLVQNPLHFTGGFLAERLGSERARDFQRLGSASEAGIVVALGADAGGQARNPFLNIMLAVRHPANPAEALTLEDALIAYTRGAAYAEFAEGEKGTLSPGMLADLAVLNQDVFSVNLEALPKTRSVLTVVGGEIVHRANEFQPGTGGSP